MAYTAPTPDDLKARYSAFADVNDAVVQYWLTDAERFVDESWPETDYAPALIANAAHHMAVEGMGATSAADKLPAGVTSFKSGAMSVSVTESVAAARGRGGYASTRYGLAFLALQRRNFGGPRVVVAGTVPACGYPYP